MFDIPLDPQQGAALLLFAVLAPFLISFVKQSGFSTQVNALIALAVYGIFGVLGAVFSGIPLTYENLTPLIIIVAVTGRAAYSMFWSKIGGDADGSGSIDDRVTTKTSIVREP